MKTTHTAIVATSFLLRAFLLALIGLTLNLNPLSFAQEQSVKSPEKLLQDPFTGLDELPSLVNLRLQTAELADGITMFKKLQGKLKGVKIEPLVDHANPPDGMVSVNMLGYTFHGMRNQPEELVENMKVELIKTEQIIKEMKASGYRPATAEEMLAVSDKLTKTHEKVWVFGTRFITANGSKYHMTVDNPGTEGSKTEFLSTILWQRKDLCIAGVKIKEPSKRGQEQPQVASTNQPSQEAKK